MSRVPTTTHSSSFKVRLSQRLRSIGPGLIFASSAIGTSHLVLSTRAGAHHGMVFFWIILAALILKYPFFEFAPRYANATGHSLINGYKQQGLWAIWLFLLVVVVTMFAVTGAIAAVSAGILSTVLGIQGIPVPIFAGLIILVTVMLLLLGGYSGLDNFIKLISIVLLVTVVTAFVAVLVKGPMEKVEGFQAIPLWEGAGLTLMISLVGWMPTGLEASMMNSIWNVEKMRITGYHPSLKEALFDFNLGYIFTALLAVMFLVIGAFTVYGSGQLLEGSSTTFSAKLIQIFSSNLGSWAKPVLAIAAFGTIYGTLVTVLDAFPRGFNRTLRAFKFTEIINNKEQQQFLDRSYKITVSGLGIGGFCLLYFSAPNMIKILEVATIISFVCAPIMGFINLRAIKSSAVPASHKPPKWLMIFAYIGLAAMTAFALYYIGSLLLQGGSLGH